MILKKRNNEKKFDIPDIKSLYNYSSKIEVSME